MRLPPALNNFIKDY